MTLLLANLALALDNLGNLDNLDYLDNLGKRALGLDTDPTLHLGSLFKEFGSSLRKLQVAPSGVAYGEVVLSNIVAVLMNIRHKETTSQLEKQLLEGYNQGCQETPMIK